MERRDACRGLSYELDAASARAQRVNVSMPFWPPACSTNASPKTRLRAYGRSFVLPVVWLVLNVRLSRRIDGPTFLTIYRFVRHWGRGVVHLRGGPELWGRFLS